jgi:hypothetical protein
MSKTMPERGEIWRFCHDHDTECRVIAILTDPLGEAKTNVAFAYGGHAGSRMMLVPLDEFLRVRELRPPFNEGDVIEYPSGLKYYVGREGNLYRINDQVAVGPKDLHLAEKIN